MIVNDFITPSVFYTGQFLAAPEINKLINNVQYLDAMSYRRETVFDSMGKKGAPSSAYHHNDPTPPGTTGFLLWRGGFLFRTGYTTLTVHYRRVGALPGTARLRIYINGTLRSEFAPALGNGSQTVALTALGFTNEQPLLIEIRTHGLSALDRTSEWWTTAVYITPAYIPPLPEGATKPRPWRLPAAFNGTYTADMLNALSEACVYLYDRMNQVPIAPNRSHLFSIMSDKAEEFECWTGSVFRFTTVDRLRIAGTITTIAATDTLKFYVNDVLLSTLGPYTPGSSSFTTLIDLTTIPVGSWGRVKVTCTSPARLNSQCSRLSMLTMRSEPPSASYPTLWPPADTATGPNYSATLVNQILNRIAFMLGAIKTRVDSSGSFTKVRAVRDNFGYDNHARRSLDRFHPLQFQRRGSRLVVYGKNVSLGFGGYAFENDDDGNVTYKYKFNNEQQIIQGDAFEVKTVYLDSVKALYPGDLYYLVGDITFAYEYAV